MMASVVMQKLIDEMPRCVLLSSGAFAMHKAHLSAELGPHFQHHTFSDVVQDNRVWVGAIQTKHILEMRKKESVSDYAKEVGKVIVRVCKVTPQVVLCFMKSYYFLKIMKDQWEKSSELLAEMKQLKYVIWEDQNSKANIREFENHVDSNVLLFAVCRGKFADMDFTDKPARAVICVDTPCPNISDVQDKRIYNMRALSQGLPDREDWLQTQIWRATNQAAGRCIRHKDDWGAVLLVNHNFRHEKHAKWIQRSLKRYDNNQQADWYTSLENFMRRIE